MTWNVNQPEGGEFTLIKLKILRNLTLTGKDTL